MQERKLGKAWDEILHEGRHWVDALARPINLDLNECILYMLTIAETFLMYEYDTLHLHMCKPSSVFEQEA